jgi:hypothetical protein
MQGDSLHGTPKTAAEKLALHLEVNYGIQLDPVRHSQLLAEIEAFAEALRPPPAPAPEPPAPTKETPRANR